jgi:hypothetical protein
MAIVLILATHLVSIAEPKNHWVPDKPIPLFAKRFLEKITFKPTSDYFG